MIPVTSARELSNRVGMVACGLLPAGQAFQTPHGENGHLWAVCSGDRDVAEFWIEMKGRFIHIRHFAVRSPEKEYLGCMEVSQDVTSIRALDGERRLLEWS